MVIRISILLYSVVSMFYDVFSLFPCYAAVKALYGMVNQIYEVDLPYILW